MTCYCITNLSHTCPGGHGSDEFPPFIRSGTEGVPMGLVSLDPRRLGILGARDDTFCLETGLTYEESSKTPQFCLMMQWT